MTQFKLKAGSKDAREHGQIILAHGEVTGHAHRVVGIETEIPFAQFFEEPDGRRVLLATEKCLLRHDEHDPVELDPAHPVQIRQGDVFLNPLGGGAWECIRQSEYDAREIRQVAD